MCLESPAYMPWEDWHFFSIANQPRKGLGRL